MIFSKVHKSRISLILRMKILSATGECSGIVVEHWTLNPEVLGSIRLGCSVVYKSNTHLLATSIQTNKGVSVFGN